LIAVLGGLLGAAYPAWMASRKDPVEALSYE
jgi:putative ABC transport system permease protein